MINQQMRQRVPKYKAVNLRGVSVEVLHEFKAWCAERGVTMTSVLCECMRKIASMRKKKVKLLFDMEEIADLIAKGEVTEQRTQQPYRTHRGKKGSGE